MRDRSRASTTSTIELPVVLGGPRQGERPWRFAHSPPQPTGMEAQQTKLDVDHGEQHRQRQHERLQEGSRRVRRPDVSERIARAGTATGNGTTAPSGTEIGNSARASCRRRATSRQGQLNQTRAATLDVAIQGNGFFQVSMPARSMYSATRNGALQMDLGRASWSPATVGPVGGDITVPADAQSITISANGQVTASPMPSDSDASRRCSARSSSRRSREPRWLRGLRARTCSPRRRRRAPRCSSNPSENGAGSLQPGHARDLERQRRQRDGRSDRGPARVRGQLARVDQGRRRDAQRHRRSLTKSCASPSSSCSSRASRPPIPSATRSPRSSRPPCPDSLGVSAGVTCPRRDRRASRPMRSRVESMLDAARVGRPSEKLTVRSTARTGCRSRCRGSIDVADARPCGTRPARRS